MKFHQSYAVTLIATALVACGGGGGDTTPAPTTVTVTCPDDSKQTRATLDLATSACPAPTLVSMTPADKATGVSPDTIATNGIVIATNSTLTTPAVSDITLKAGTTSVPVTVTMVGTKGFKVSPSAKLLYAQAYTFLANVKDSLGKKLSVSGGFTTASVSCVAPLVPDTAGTSCVPPVCPTGTAWNGSACVTTVLRYTDRVYAIWTGAYPYAVTKTGVARVVNKTHFPGTAPFFNCWLAEKPLADGKVLTSCQESLSLARNVFYIDPTKDEMYDYAGQVPADNVWHGVTPVAQQQPGWDANAKVSDGWYFTTDTGGWELYFRSDATGAVTTVKAGTFAVDETVRLLMSYTK